MARQMAKLANGNIPYHRSHGHFINGVGQGAGICFLSSRSSDPLLSGSSNFSGSLGLIFSP